MVHARGKRFKYVNGAINNSLNEEARQIVMYEDCFDFTLIRKNIRRAIRYIWRLFNISV